MHQDLQERIKHLEQSFDQLSDQFSKAWQYSSTDPQASLNKVRIILEKIVKRVYAIEIGEEPGDLMIGSALRDPVFRKNIERRIHSKMNAIRSMTNLAVHGEHVTANDALHSLDNLCDVMEWYIFKYESGSALHHPKTKRFRTVPFVLTLAVSALLISGAVYFYNSLSLLPDLEAKGEYRNGERSGKWEETYQIEGSEGDYYVLEGNYLVGKRHGAWNRYDSSGKVEKVIVYGLGEYQSISEYKENGVLVRKSKYKLGEFKELILFGDDGESIIEKYELQKEMPEIIEFRKLEYSVGSCTSQEYRLYKKRGDIQFASFDIYLDQALSKGKKGKRPYTEKDGLYEMINDKGKPLEEGTYRGGIKVEDWKFYDYKQKVILVKEYDDNGILENEKYLTIDKELFSGDFKYIDNNAGIQEIRKIKDGLRHGKTVIFDTDTEEVLKKEKYKDGVLM